MKYLIQNMKIRIFFIFNFKQQQMLNYYARTLMLDVTYLIQALHLSDLSTHFTFGQITLK